VPSSEIRGDDQSRCLSVSSSSARPNEGRYRCGFRFLGQNIVWDLDSGRQLRTLQGHSHFVWDVAVSPDGRRAVSASDDKTLEVWDLKTGAVVATFTCDASAMCCAFAGAQSIVAGDFAGRVHFLELMEKS
jgi:WD40 repeat protein